MKDPIVCYWANVSRETIEKAIKDGAKSIEDIRWSTHACKDNKCKEKNPKGVCCEHEIKQMIIDHHGDIEGPKCSCCG